MRISSLIRGYQTALLTFCPEGKPVQGFNYSDSATWLILSFYTEFTQVWTIGTGSIRQGVSRDRDMLEQGYGIEKASVSQAKRRLMGKRRELWSSGNANMKADESAHDWQS